MIDSVLKGTGNSRFLKSAVPAGTSWADALAMLHSGTFPIDFNGINTEGFQQVGTPLNKANLLKDATAAQIGLPPSTTPDGMFRALGNTGELHVWRKTVVNASEKPAGYTLGIGEKTTLIIKSLYGSGTQYANVEYGNACAVYDNGEAYITNSTTTSNFIVTDSSTLATLNNTLKGKFCKFHAVSGSNRLTVSDGVFFIPSNATFQNETPTSGDTKITVDVAQKVNAYPLTPAGTTTTYPVSTKPNAYQEGDDAKEAGYVVGDATSMKIISYADGSGYYVRFYTADSVSVSDSGALSIVEDNNSAPLISKSSDGSELRGKYIKYHSSYQVSTEIVSGMIYFVPSNAVFTWSNGMLICDKVQLVTGYAAIPAETTIEYLGKLGDKARVQVVSYVGTGTYGSSNPNSLTFDFVPKMVIIRQENDAYAKFDWIIGTTSVEVHLDGSYNCFVAIDGNKLSFYSLNASLYQMNESGEKYYAVAIG